MKRNVGTVDRIIRIVVAITFIILILTGVVHGAGAIVMGVFAGIFAFTGIFAHCPIYFMIGIHTLRTKSGPDD